MSDLAEHGKRKCTCNNQSKSISAAESYKTSGIEGTRCLYIDLRSWEGVLKWEDWLKICLKSSLLPRSIPQPEGLETAPSAMLADSRQDLLIRAGRDCPRMFWT